MRESKTFVWMSWDIPDGFLVTQIFVPNDPRLLAAPLLSWYHVVWSRRNMQPILTNFPIGVCFDWQQIEVYFGVISSFEPFSVGWHLSAGSGHVDLWVKITFTYAFSWLQFEVLHKNEMNHYKLVQTICFFCNNSYSIGNFVRCEQEGAVLCYFCCLL